MIFVKKLLCCLLVGLSVWFSRDELFAKYQLDRLLIHPDVILRNRDQIGMSNEQIDFIREQL